MSYKVVRRDLPSVVYEKQDVFPDTAFFTYADHNRSFEAIGGWTAAAVAVAGQGEPEEVRAIFVTKGALEARWM